MEDRCQAIDRSTGETCNQQARWRADRRDRDGTMDELRLCQNHYEAFRLNGLLVGDPRPL